MSVREKEKKPSAMKQVHNKVNAGIMDAVAYGGMCEAADPEDEEYQIGMEDGGLEPYAHVKEGKKTMFVTEEQLRQMKMLLEENENHSDYQTYIKSFIKFLRSQHLSIDPLPEIELNDEEQDGLFIKTGYYSPDERKIVAFTNGRHIKDVMRTIAHEFVHHMQNVQDPDKDWGSNGDLEQDRKLRGIEGEAYLLGNILFREWTEKVKKDCDINESVLENRGLLVENEGTNMKKARRYLESKGYGNPEERQRVLDAIRTDIPNVRLEQCKFLLGVTRMFLEGQLDSAESVTKLNKTLKYIASAAHVNEYDNNLNNENLEALVERFRGVARADLEQSRAASNARQLTINNEYTIVPINSQAAAARYAKFFPDDTTERWCVTYRPEMYETYTNGGVGRFYFCLRNGFENEPHERGENFPLDSYGLSMIAVSIMEDGDCNTITCRWNHAGWADDHIMSVEQLENILGRNFYQTFKPYTDEELYAKGIIPLNMVQGLLDSGKRLNELFDYVDEEEEDLYFYQRNKPKKPKMVVIRNKANFITSDKKLVSPKWFNIDNPDEWGYDGYNDEEYWDNTDIKNRVFPFDAEKAGFARIQYCGKFNFLKLNGELVSNVWYDAMWPQKCDIKAPFFTFVVEKNGLLNLVDCDGNLVFKQWFKNIGGYAEGFWRVEVPIDTYGGYYNFVDINGNFLSKTNFDEAEQHFNEGFAKIRDFSFGANFLNKNGEIVSKQWFDQVESFSHGIAKVKKDGNYNYINQAGNLLSQRWFDEVETFRDYVYDVVGPNGQKYNFITVPPFGIVAVKTSDGQGNKPRFWNVVDKNGNFLSKEWFKVCGRDGDLRRFLEDYAIKNYINGQINRDERENYRKDELYENTDEIVEPDDVDLSSFNIKKHLNPKFWDDGHLDTRIRLRLLDIADDFFDSLGVDWVEPEDVIITGSIANYNWNRDHSDIDLHILVDYEDVDERVDFVREYFTLKKNEWNDKHKGLRIFGFPVEVYVQDANEPHASSGVYSIDRDEWITEPDREKLRAGKVDKRHIREMVSTYMNKIDNLIDIYKHHKGDEYEMRKVADDAAEMMGEIKKLRKDDLAKYNREMCDGNIIFKALRRSDYIGKLIKLKNLAYDKINSL